MTIKDIVIAVLFLVVMFAYNHYGFLHRHKDALGLEGDEMHESGMINKPRVIVIKGVSNMKEFQEELLPMDCDEETYGHYQLEVDGNNAKIILQNNVNLKDTVSLLTSLYLDLDETHVKNPSDRIKCYYPIAKVSFGRSVINTTDAVIYPVGKPKDLVVHICTRDNKVYKYMEGTETMEELE